VRLNKLSMSNIGPYVGLVSLDFAKLGDIFLICGKTGSGKTTIFDALAYALYGGAAGTREMTSHFAGTTDDVFVELEFMVGKAGWKVLRKPARQSLKKKGSGMMERPSEVVLWHREGAAWIPAGDKTSDVDSTLERVIGLSADEFTKIVLLPQGEFQRFLEMKTGDRTEILEKLFPVTIHSAVSELAKLKARDTEVQARDLDSRIKSIEMEVGETPEIELETAKASLDAARAAEKAALATLDSAKSAEQAASIGARAFAELDAAEAERDALLATASEAASARARLARAEAAAGIGGFIEAARRARAELLEARRIHDEATRSVAASDAGSAEVQQHETRLADLNTGLVAMDHESGLLSAKQAAWERLSLASARLSGARERLSEARSVREASSQELAAKAEALALLESRAGDTVVLEAGRAVAAAGPSSATACTSTARGRGPDWTTWRATPGP